LHSGGNTTPSVLHGAEASCGNLAISTIWASEASGGPASTPASGLDPSSTSGGMSVKKANDPKFLVALLNENLAMRTNTSASLRKQAGASQGQ
jgi:hypothetical protein